MSIEGRIFIFKATRSDKKRDALIPLPEGVKEYRDISYGPHGGSNLLDVYVPEGTAEPLPTIVSIHGGGYVYGNKEIYRRYGMDMAARGFAFVNFNYRLAPQWKFPTPLWDTNTVMDWICKNAERYHLDPSRIILVGDSAGAELASQYAAIATNPDYAALFHMKVPPITIKALGLNCGLYDIANLPGGFTGLARDYLGTGIKSDDPRLQVLSAITDHYPPAFIMTACEDYMKVNAEPMCDYLTSKGVPAEWKCYGSEGDKTVGHVFHVNILQPEAVRCNDDEAEFFRRFV